MAFRNNNLFTILFIFLCLTLPQLAKSQGIGINNTSPDASAILDLTATDRGLLVPRMTQIQKNAISSPATGLLIFQTDVDIGYYFYDSSAWIKLTSSSETTWTKSGNFVYNSSDSVGIGTSTPNQKLHINGALQTSYLYPGLGNNTVYRYVKFGDPTESWGGLMYNISSTNYGDGDDFTIYTYGGRDLVLRAGSPGEVHIPFGNVGIGTTTPSTKLEIDGQIKITGGSPSANKVLTSDADGLATWEAVPGAEDRQDSNISIAGWYRIAECTGGGKRANATFVLTDKISGGGHSTVAFKIGVSYNQIDNSHFILLSHNYYSTKTFTKIRLLTNTTYDEMYLEVYAARTGNVYSTIYHNHNTDGWNSVDWSAGSIPTGYTATEHSLEAQFAVGNNTESFFVSNDGNVGIGTTANSQTLTGDLWADQSAIPKQNVVTLPSNTTVDVGIHNELSSTTDPANSLIAYGIYNKNSIASNNVAVGIYNKADSTSTGSRIGILNYAYGKASTNNQVYGINNTTNSRGSGDTYGIYSSNVSLGSGNNYNFYAYGDAINYFQGNVGVGVGTNSSTEKLAVAGAVELLTTTAPSSTTNKLYNASGNLFWNGTQLNSNSSSAFIDGGNSFGATATLGTNDGYSLAIETNGTERMTINSAGKVGIGAPTPSANLHVKSSSAGEIFKLESTEAGTQSGPDVNLYRNSSSPADDDFLGRFVYNGENSNGDIIEYGQIKAQIGNVTSTDEGFNMFFQGMVDGTNRSFLGLRANDGGGIADQAEVTINENSIDMDFRIESDINTHAFFVRGSDSKVGIGTSSPQRALQLKGNAGAFALEGDDHIYMEFYPDGYSNGRKGYLGYPSSNATQISLFTQGENDLVFGTDGSERMRIDSTGNIGMGISAPTARLHIKEDGSNPGIKFTHGGSNLYATIQGPSNRHLYFDLDGNGAADKFLFRNMGSYGAADLLVIQADGKVGIGESSPLHILHIDAGSSSGKARLESNATNYTAWMIANNGGGKALSYYDAIDGNFAGGDYGSVGQTDAGYMEYSIGTSSPKPYHIFTGGNVGIGTTAPDTKLHVAGTIRTNDKLEYKDLLDANNITGKIEKIKKLTSSSVVVFEDSYIEITVTSYGDFIKLKAKTGYNGNWNTSRIPWKDDGSCSYAYIGDNLACIYSGASDGSISVSTSTPVIASINTSDGYSKGQADMWVITKEDGSSPLYRITLYKVSSSFGWAIAEAYYD